MAKSQTVAKKELLKTKETRTGKAELLMRTAVEKLIGKMFQGMTLTAEDITVKDYQWLVFRGKLESRNKNSNLTKAVIVSMSWPEGMERHGETTVESFYVPTPGAETEKKTKRYVCWKNDNGDEILFKEWSTPPSVYEYWHKYGTFWPRGKNRLRLFGEIVFGFVGLSTVLVFVFLMGMLTTLELARFLLGLPELLLQRSSISVTELVLLSLSMCVGSSLGTFFAFSSWETERTQLATAAWKRDLLKDKIPEDNPKPESA